MKDADGSSVLYDLGGFVKLLDGGFALPCYTRGANTNAWYVAACDPTGDHNGFISSFDVFEPDELHVLPMRSRRSASVGDNWLDVFIWQNEAFVGRPDEIFGALIQELENLEQAIPLSLLDLALSIPNLNADRYAHRAFSFLEEKFDTATAVRWRDENYVRKRLLRRLRFVEELSAIARDSGGPHIYNSIEVSSWGLDNFRIELPSRRLAELFWSKANSSAMVSELSRAAAPFKVRSAKISHSKSDTSSSSGSVSRSTKISFAEQLELILADRRFIRNFASRRWVYVSGFRNLVERYSILSLRPADVILDLLKSLSHEAVARVPTNWKEAFPMGDWAKFDSRQIDLAFGGLPLRLDKACMAAKVLEIFFLKEDSSFLRNRSVMNILGLQPAVYLLLGHENLNLFLLRKDPNTMDQKRRLEFVRQFIKAHGIEESDASRSSAHSFLRLCGEGWPMTSDNASLVKELCSKHELGELQVVEMERPATPGWPRISKTPNPAESKYILLTSGLLEFLASSL